MKRFLSNFFYNIFLICLIISTFIVFHSETKSKPSATNFDFNFYTNDIYQCCFHRLKVMIAW